MSEYFFAENGVSKHYTNPAQVSPVKEAPPIKEDNYTEEYDGPTGDEDIELPSNRKLDANGYEILEREYPPLVTNFTPSDPEATGTLEWIEPYDVLPTQDSIPNPVATVTTDTDVTTTTVVKEDTPPVVTTPVPTTSKKGKKN